MIRLASMFLDAMKKVQKEAKTDAKETASNKNNQYENATLEIVAVELGKAKGKHHCFPENPAEALSIIGEEFGELAAAINDKENKIRQIEEAAHVAVTAIRFIESRLKSD